MCVLRYLSVVCLYVYAFALNPKSEVHCGSAVRFRRDSADYLSTAHHLRRAAPEPPRHSEPVRDLFSPTFLFVLFFFTSFLFSKPDVRRPVLIDLKESPIGLIRQRDTVGWSSGWVFATQERKKVRAWPATLGKRIKQSNKNIYQNYKLEPSFLRTQVVTRAAAAHHTHQKHTLAIQ